MSRRDAVFLCIAMLLFGAAYAGFASAHPWRQGFDDFDHIPAARTWAATLHLTSDGLFLRVPLWPVLLGTFFRCFGESAGLFLLQSGIVAGTLACYLVFTAPVRERLHPLTGYLPAAAFALAPQTVLYARHAVNEPLGGLLVALALLLGGAPERPRPLLLGVVCGAAAMNKPVLAFLALPAIAYVALDRRGVAVRGIGRLILGAALVVVPFVLLHVAQRGPVHLDTTTAYNLSRYNPQQWLRLGDHGQRHEAGLADWRNAFFGNPVEYLRGFAGRLGGWIARPSSADFALYYEDYPHRAIRFLDHALLWGLALLAAVGWTKRHASIWCLVVLIALSCTFPPHTPFSPKILLVYPLLLLAPQGLLRLHDRWPHGPRQAARRA